MTFAETNTPAARAARNVPNNPNPLCRDFTPKAAPSEFWCANCRWNESMHADENARAAIAAELARRAAAAAPEQGVVPNVSTEHQPVTVWVGTVECLERECDDYFTEDGDTDPGVERCSHLREEQACSCQRQVDGEYGSAPCPALAPTP
jgi:hypothetical protein